MARNPSGFSSAFGKETGRTFIYDNVMCALVPEPPKHDDWSEYVEFIDDDGERSYASGNDEEHYTLDAEEFGPIPGAIAYVAKHGLDQYRKMYCKGWVRSERVGSIPDGPVADDDAWMDGYLDSATGRDKWHLLYCPEHEACP